MHIILILINGPPLMAGPAINGPPSTALQATASSLKYSMLAAGNKTRPTCCPPPPPPLHPLHRRDHVFRRQRLPPHAHDLARRADGGVMGAAAAGRHPLPSPQVR